MCGSAPKVVQSDPQAEADAAADAAAKAANADAAARKKRKQGSSLLASGAEGATDTGSSCCPLAHRPQKYVRGLIHGSTRQPVNQAR
jgi:hypothetical protein